MRKHGENMYFEDFELGMKWDLDRPIHISRELMRDYASKYDAAPIHNDDEVGKRSKFGQIIAPGTMTSMLLWSEWIRRFKTLDNFQAGSSSYIDWFTPLLEGDDLTGTCEVIETTSMNPHNGKVVVEFHGYNQKGEHCIKVVDTLYIGKTPEGVMQGLRDRVTQRTAEVEKAEAELAKKKANLEKSKKQLKDAEENGL